MAAEEADDGEDAGKREQDALAGAARVGGWNWMQRGRQRRGRRARRDDRLVVWTQRRQLLQITLSAQTALWNDFTGTRQAGSGPCLLSTRNREAASAMRSNSEVLPHRTWSPAASLQEL